MQKDAFITWLRNNIATALDSRDGTKMQRVDEFFNEHDTYLIDGRLFKKGVNLIGKRGKTPVLYLLFTSIDNRTQPKITAEVKIDPQKRSVNVFYFNVGNEPFIFRQREEALSWK